MNDALGYIQVSSEEQADSGLGLQGRSLEELEASCQGRPPNALGGLGGLAGDHRLKSIHNAHGT